MILYAEYRRLLDLMEDVQDAREIESFRAALEAGRENLVLAEVVDRILGGETPLRVWRKHRGLTQ